MFSNPSVLPNLWFDLAACALVLGLFGLVGRLIAGHRLHGDEALARLAGMLVTGMLFVVGMGTTIIYRHLGVYTIVPLLLMAASIVVWRRFPPAVVQVSASEQRRLWVGLAIVLLGVVALNAWFRDCSTSDGMLRLPHGDIGFYGMLAKALPTAPVSNGWVATMGPIAIENGVTDQWYHWGPIWLTMIIIKLTGLSSLEVLNNVCAPVLGTMIVICAAAIVRALTRLSISRSLLVGASALVLNALPMALFVWISHWGPDGWMRLRHDNLFYNFSYLFEAIQVFTIALCWLRGRRLMALLFIVCATISSPHFVAGIGVALGMLMIFALIKRDLTLARQTGLAVVTILLTWAMLRFGFHYSDAGGGSAGKLWNLTSPQLLERGAALMSNLGLLIAASILLIPGWLGLARQCREDMREQTRLLAWLPFTGLVGGLVANTFSDHFQKFHFVEFPYVVLALPLAVIGYGVLLGHQRRWVAGLAVAVLLGGSAWGTWELGSHPKRARVTTLTVEDASTLKKYLNGAPFGYVANVDRPWWLPINASLAAALDSRCIRLNVLKEADFEDPCSQYYADFLPFAVQCFRPHEKIPTWSLEFARALKLDYILATSNYPVLDDIAKECDPVLQTESFLLYKIKAAKPIVATASAN
jgi:hypothetical protein